MKSFVDNWGMFLLMKDFMKLLGGAKGLKAFMQHENYRLAVAVQSALECGANCRRPPNDVVSLLFRIARHKGILKESYGGAECRVEQVPEPNAPPPHVMEEYFQMIDEVVIDKMCEYVMKPPTGVVSEEEALAYYQALMSAPFYVAFRKAVYDRLAKLYRYRRILDIGAGTQDPLDMLDVCQQHGSECELAALEVDPRICNDLEKLATKRGFEVVCGWGRVSGRYDIAVVQNVLHWTTNPLQVLLDARRRADRLFVSQGVIEGAGIGFVLVKILYANQPLSWKEVEAFTKQAGWRLARRYAKYPNYLALFK